MSLLNLSSPAGQSPRGKKSLKMWMGAGLVVAVLGIGSTLASNININSGEDGTEFGQGVTKTVYCGADNDEEESITVSPLSKFVNSTYGYRITSAAVQAVAENSFTARFATSVYNSNSSDFISSTVSTKVVNGRTGVWLTKRGNESNVTVASNQDETTFTSQQRADYVFSQPNTTRSNVRGFYKVNGTLDEKIVIAPAIAARSEQRERYENPGDFYFKGIVISDIPDNCEGKNFIISGYDEESPDAQTLIDLSAGTDITEVVALWSGDSQVLPRVSRERNYWETIAANVTASQTSDQLSLIFGGVTTQSYLPTDSLYRLVVETQENTLGGYNND